MNVELDFCSGHWIWAGELIFCECEENGSFSFTVREVIPTERTGKKKKHYCIDQGKLSH